jgi:CubicO group peptidase (beta-lactamase class C family)
MNKTHSALYVGLIAMTTLVAAPMCAQAATRELPLISKAESVGLSTDRLGRIDEVIQRHIDEGNISGAVVALARRGKLVKYAAYGYADAAARMPMRKDALFQMYSSTKVVTAVAVLMLYEEGRIGLDNPVSRYIPEFDNARVAVRKDGASGTYAPRAAGTAPPEFDTVPAARNITVRDLMTHTAGLLSSDPRRIGMTAPVRAAGESLASYARRLGSVPLDFQPGTRWSYSPLAGSDVLAGLVEIISGKTFDQFTRERIFAPIGMNDTYFNPPRDKVERLLPVLRKIDSTWQTMPPERTSEAPMRNATNVDQGSMGLASTAYDYLLLHQMLLDKGVSLRGQRLLGTRTVELMATNHVGELYRGEGAYAKPMLGHGFGMQVQIVLDRINGDTGRSNGAFGWAGYLGTMGWTDPSEAIAAVIMLQQNVRAVHIDYEHAIRQAIIN